MIKNLLKRKIEAKFPGVVFDILVPPSFAKASEGRPDLGDYSTNIAFALAKKDPEAEISNAFGKNKSKSRYGASGKDPVKVAGELVEELKKDKDFVDVFERIEAAKPGFVNFYLKDDFVRAKLGEIAEDKNYGFNETMKGETVMVEYTDPNPFKLFHIGHLMSNTIGEAIARLYEASGAKVLRVTWQGDVGMHIAMAVWGMLNAESGEWKVESGKWDMEKMGQAYAKGAKAYKEDEDAKKEIEEINNEIYDRSDDEINKLYDMGKKLSLEYFETIYEKLGTKFDRYFFESELGQKGIEMVRRHPEVFEESEGAVVFHGEKYGLHTRVFINSSGLPVYESKELGLNKEKFELYNPDLSVIVTGNEINEYFKVLLKVMELTMPDVAARTRHISHGMLRLPGGKMSSRTGDVITAESLIEQTKSRLPETEDEEAREKIAIGAIKYSILKQSPGHDIIFDFDKSLSVKGDSAPYLQYTYARLNSILNKSNQTNYQLPPRSPVATGIPAGEASLGTITNYQLLTDPTELKLIKRLLMFPDVVMESGEKIFPQHLALYLYELANDANRFYESVRVLDDENTERKNARLVLVATVAGVLERGLGLLGIEALDRI